MKVRFLRNIEYSENQKDIVKAKVGDEKEINHPGLVKKFLLCGFVEEVKERQVQAETQAPESSEEKREVQAEVSEPKPKGRRRRSKK